MMDMNHLQWVNEKLTEKTLSKIDHLSNFDDTVYDLDLDMIMMRG